MAPFLNDMHLEFRRGFGLKLLLKKYVLSTLFYVIFYRGHLHPGQGSVGGRL